MRSPLDKILTDINIDKLTQNKKRSTLCAVLSLLFSLVGVFALIVTADGFPTLLGNGGENAFAAYALSFLQLFAVLSILNACCLCGLFLLPKRKALPSETIKNRAIFFPLISSVISCMLILVQCLLLLWYKDAPIENALLSFVISDALFLGLSFWCFPLVFSSVLFSIVAFIRFFYLGRTEFSDSEQSDLNERNTRLEKALYILSLVISYAIFLVGSFRSFISSPTGFLGNSFGMFYFLIILAETTILPAAVVQSSGLFFLKHRQNREKIFRKITLFSLALFLVGLLLFGIYCLVSWISGENIWIEPFLQVPIFYLLWIVFAALGWCISSRKRRPTPTK